VVASEVDRGRQKESDRGGAGRGMNDRPRTIYKRRPRSRRSLTLPTSMKAAINNNQPMMKGGEGAEGSWLRRRWPADRQKEREGSGRRGTREEPSTAVDNPITTRSSYRSPLRLRINRIAIKE